MRRLIFTLISIVFAANCYAANIDTTAPAMSPIGAKLFGATAAGNVGWIPAYSPVIGGGDGVADDGPLLRAAIASGENIELVPGKTYLTSFPLVLQAGQTLRGNGSTIKRANQLHTTTTTAIVSGSTRTITVSNATGFSVGQQITILNGSTFDTSNRVIDLINGNDIRVSTTFGVSVSGTTDVYLSFDTITTSDYSTIENLVIDGNRSNWPFRRWQNTSEIGQAGSYAVLSGVTLKECPGEAMQEHSVGDLVGCVYEKINVYNSNGNGIHLSGSSGTAVKDFYGVNMNLDATIGHVDGAIILSNAVAHARIDGFYVDNAKSGIGSLDSLGNSGITITNGVIKNCTSTAIEGTIPSGEEVNNVDISNIRIYDSVKLDINQTSAGSATKPKRWRLANIYLENTQLYISNAVGLDLVNVDANYAGNTTAVPVSINNSQDVTYVSGEVNGGATGVYVAGSASKRVKIGPGVRTNGQKANGLYFNGVGEDCVADGVSIMLDSTAAATCYGILQSAKTVAQNCVIRMDHGFGVLQSGNDSITLCNIIRMASGTSIKNYGGSTGNFAINNLISQAVSNGGGVSNTFTTNVTIPQ